MAECEGPVMPTVRPGPDQLQDLPGRGERLAGAGRSLNREVGAIQDQNQADRRLGHRLAAGPQRARPDAGAAGPQAQQQGGGGVRGR